MLQEVSQVRNAWHQDVGWGSGGTLEFSKFDAAGLGTLVEIQVDYWRSMTGCTSVRNLDSVCAPVQYSIVSQLPFQPSSQNNPPVSLPSENLGSTEGTVPFVQLAFIPPPGGCNTGGADAACPGNGLGYYKLSMAKQMQAQVIVQDPSLLTQWVLGTGNDAVRISYSANAQPQGSFGGIVDLYLSLSVNLSVTVTYRYCTTPLGSPYCAGDGTGTACPCGNTGTSGAGCANSTGAGGLLFASGSNVVSADDLVLHASGLPSQAALTVVGTGAAGGGAGNPFGAGLRCVSGTLVRLGVELTGASGSASWGPGLAALGGWQPGDVRYFQTYYRDPAMPGCPDFNLTNGLQLVFQ